MNRKTIIGTCLLTLFAASTIQAGPPRRAYDLKLEAMQDVNQTTDVYLTLEPRTSSVSSASQIDHLQMKSFNVDGNLNWTQNEFLIPLEPDSASMGASGAMFSYQDMVRHQPVQAQVQVKNADSSKTHVIRTKAPVFLRPDLTVMSVHASTQVHVGEVTNISSVITELNGDLGANATVTLKNGAEELDAAFGVVVNPNGNADVVFSALFEEVGTYTLTVCIEDSDPGLYDTSHNCKDVVVEVINDVNATPYYMGYWYSDQDYHYDWSSSYGQGSYSFSGEQQSLYSQIQIDGSNGILQFPLQGASISVGLDNAAPIFSMDLNLIAADSSWNSGCYSGASAWRDLGNGFYFYASSYDNCGTWKGSYASINQYASDYVYFSEAHNYYWGDYSNSSVVKEGVFLHPTDSVQVSLVVTSNDGTSYGGASEVTNLQTDSWDNVIDYHYGDYWQTGFNRGTRTSGYSNGITSP